MDGKKNGGVYPMNFEETKGVIEKLADENYEAFVKALLSFEKNISDQAQLEKLYTAYMENDEMGLLNDGFDEVGKVV